MSQRLYIMPDGRPLRAYLADTEAARTVSRTGNRRKDHSEEKGWSEPTFVSDEEQAQIDAAMRGGRARRRRYFNDKLLRDMAGALTHSDMQDLFKPVPFGEPVPVTYVQQAAALPFWDTFRSIDMDKQKRIMQALEAQSRQQAACSSCPHTKHSDARMRTSAALRSWSRINRRARQALKRANFAVVHALEVSILQQLAETGGAEAVLELPCAFDRLLAHALAQYQGLESHGYSSEGDAHLVVVKPHAAQGLTWDQRDVTCSDVLLALESLPHGGLTPAALQAFLFSDTEHPQDHLHGCQR